MNEKNNEKDKSIDYDAQRGTQLGLTHRQIEIAKILADPTETGTIKDICEREQLPRRTFYNWMGKKEFIDFINSLIDKYTDAELAGVWKALSLKARKGDIQAIKLFFEMKGKYKEVKEVNHNFNDLTPEEREQRLNELMGKISNKEE